MRYQPKNRAGQKMWSADAVDQPDGLLAAALQLKRSDGAGPHACVPLAPRLFDVSTGRAHTSSTTPAVRDMGCTVAIEVDEVRCRAESITGAPRCFDAPLATRTRWGISS